MEGAGSRTHATARRMASSRAASGSRSSSATSGPGAGDDGLPVSPARWLGVALVLGCLVMAMAMAMTSEVALDPGRAGAAVAVQVATPSPSVLATGADVPSEAPEIALVTETTSDPSSGLVTRAREVTLAVTVPETTLRPRQLKLRVLRDGSQVDEVRRPVGAVEPKPIELREGPNTLSVRLVGPAGPGPESNVITVTLDTRPPDLAVEAPRADRPVDGERITLKGASDPGATITVLNRKTGVRRTQTVGPQGRFEETIALEKGDNVIRIEASDLAGNVTEDVRTVTRSGADVESTLTVEPKAIQIRKLPATVRISARLRDEGDRPVKDAEVTFTLAVPGLPVQSSPVLRTRADGTVTWAARVDRAGVETGNADITMVARLPGGGRVPGHSDDLVFG